jgi:hypothetical protein
MSKIEALTKHIDCSKFTEDHYNRINEIIAFYEDNVTFASNARLFLILQEVAHIQLGHYRVATKEQFDTDRLLLEHQSKILLNSKQIHYCIQRADDYIVTILAVPFILHELSKLIDANIDVKELKLRYKRFHGKLHTSTYIYTKMF